MKIITADQRMAEKSGAKILIVGQSKIGKTSLLKTLSPKRTLFLDLEAGDLAVKDVPVDTLRPRTWDECRDLACFLTGPNPSFPPTACYSQAHYDAIRANFEGLALDRYDTFFVDSITAAAPAVVPLGRAAAGSLLASAAARKTCAAPTGCTGAR